MRESRRLVSELEILAASGSHAWMFELRIDHFSPAEAAPWAENREQQSQFDFASDFATFLSFGGFLWSLVSL